MGVRRECVFLEEFDGITPSLKIPFEMVVF
jgi:hypothetical protein